MGLYQKQGKWFIDYYHQGRRVREAVGTSKKAAEQALATRKTEILQGRYHWLDEKRAITFDVLAEEYEKYSKANKRSWQNDIYLIHKLTESFGGRLITGITPFLAEKYKGERLKAGVRPATVNRELACLKHMFSLAVRWGKLTDQPLRKVKLLREENCIEQILTADQETKLLAAAKEPLHSMLVVALNTGMRRGEIFALTWSCVDYKRMLITVINSKSGRSRKIPMNEAVVSVLKKLQPTGGSGFAFADPKTGKPFGSVKTAFLTALKTSKIPPLRFHDLRHTFATRLVAAGSIC